MKFITQLHLQRRRKKKCNTKKVPLTHVRIEMAYLRFAIGIAAAACIGGGTLYGNGNFAATAGFSNNMISNRLHLCQLRNCRVANIFAQNAQFIGIWEI